MTALDALMARSLDDGEDRMRWLVARQGRVTASMVGKLALGGASARREVIEDSLKPPVEITGNKYIDRGHEREPAIAAWITSHWPLIQGNLHLFAAEGNERHAATPDGIGTDTRGRLVLAEIKTSKYDRSPEDPYFPRTGYAEQMQWQMYVTGAVATLYVWEQHDDDWENGPFPIHPEPRWCWVRRDEARIAELIELANVLLAERDALLTSEPPELVDEELARLAAEVLEARAAKAAAEAVLKERWSRTLELVASREEFSVRGVTWSNRVQVGHEPDVEAALAAGVEGHSFTGAELKAQADRSREVWEAHLARFSKPVERSVQKLTITQPKLQAADSPLELGEF